jgi:adenine-specific DNA-methyltransferase
VFVSRFTDLIAKVKAKDPQLGADLDREFRVLSSRLSFGLNFERHRPEAVELPQRPVRRGDKVRVLPPRGSTAKGDQRLWLVKAIHRASKTAELELLAAPQPEAQTVPLDDVIVVAEFRDTIYPGLVSTGSVSRGGDKPWHTVINGENYHVLKALTWTHRGKVDAIYIDPPYNTRDKDWKYNNDYVNADDLYRHSKWLAMMERRLLLAKELLNPADSVLIVTIDEKEYLRLGLLLEQTFPEATIQMVSIVINPSGTSRDMLSRVDEYAFFCFVGAARPCDADDDLLTEAEADGAETELHGVRWERLMRGGGSWYRDKRRNLCYPVLLNSEHTRMIRAGEPLQGEDENRRPEVIDGHPVAWPVRSDGRLGIWRVEGRKLNELIEKGYAYVSSKAGAAQPTLRYLLSGTVERIDAGELKVVGKGERGEVQVDFPETARKQRVKTVWNRARHIAGGAGGALLLNSLFGDRGRFTYPKSLYAVEDTLRIATGHKPTATVVDFFSGSGTTAHAVMRLNKQDGGRRQCICVTNNEVSADEQQALREKGLRPGDAEWEQWGICDYITKPRVQAAITGKTPDGEPIKGDYKFTDEFPMSDGFEETAEFFTLTYETPVAVSYQTAFARIAPLLWLRAGSVGRRIDKLPAAGWEVADTYGLLVELDKATDFLKAAREAKALRIAYIVTDDERRFQALARRLPEGVEAIRLYESYLTNFAFANGDSA